VKRLSAILSAIPFVPALLLAEPQTVQCLLRAPVGVDVSKLSVTIHDGPPVESETDWAAPTPIAVDAKGAFAATWDAKPETQFEIVGPGVRRARFPWPNAVAGDEGARATFDLDGGWSIDGVVVDGTTGAPIANVLLGPVVPGTDANEIAMEKSFPFFVRTDAEGKFVVEGLASTTSWEIPFLADGYMRQRLQTVPGSSMRVELTPGGRAIAGTLAGSRTAAPMADRLVLVTGGPRNLHIIRRTDAKAEFRFAGLAAGEYEIAAWSPSAGTGPMQRLLVTEAVDVEGLVVFWPEGIRLAGVARDIETGDLVAGAALTLRDWLIHTDTNGAFEFPLVEAPWPVTIAGDHPQFQLVAEDQGTERWPINGSDGVDIADIDLKMRRKRVLQVSLALDPPVEGAEAAGVLELHGPPVPGAKAPATRNRIALGTTTVPLETAGERLAFMRLADGRATEVALVDTDIRQTTTTLALTLAQGGAVEGSFRYEAEEPPRAPAAPAFTVRLEAAFPPPSDRERIEVASATPTADGNFTLPGLPPGEFRLLLVRPEGEPWMEETVRIERGATVEFHRTIPRGVPVAGIVTDEEDAPLREVAVSAYGDDPTGRALHLKAVSDADGKFRFEGFGGAALREISATHAIHGSATLNDVAIPNEAIALAMKKPSGIVVKMAEGSNAPEALLLAGMLRSSSDGTSQWFYDIESRTPFAGEREVTVRPRSVNRIRIAAGSGRDWDVSPPFDWSPTREGKEVVLQPLATSSLEVDVIGADLEALGDIEATLINTSLPETVANLEFADPAVQGGRLVFASLPAGEYMLIAYAPGGESSVVNNIDIARGATARATLTISAPDVELAGRALATDGNPVANAPVRLRFANVAEAEVLLDTTTAKDGTFSLFPLEAGRAYMVEIGGTPQSWTVDIPADSGEVAQREFLLSIAVEATLAWPESLGARLKAGLPAILRNAAANRAEIVQNPLAGETLMLFPGRYEVSLGEDRVGIVEVPTNGGTARVIAE